MSLIETLTSFQPSPKDINDTPKSVRKYIRSLETIITEYISKELEKTILANIK